MTLKDIFPRYRRKQSSQLHKRFSAWGEPEFEAIQGRYGYITLNGRNVDVVVDVCSPHVQKRVSQILGEESGYMPIHDGEYMIRLNFTDKYRALQLIGLRPDRRG